MSNCSIIQSYYTELTTNISATFQVSQSDLPYTSSSVVVSLNSDGAVQRGAGTSVYLNVGNVTARCPSYLDMIPIFNDTYLISYADESNSSSSVEAIQMTRESNGFLSSRKVLPTQFVPYFLYEIETLCQSSGLFVAITQEFTNTSSAYILAGSLRMDSNSSSMLSLTWGEPMPYTFGYSLSPQISRLSDNSFAIVYYNNASNVLLTRHGLSPAS